MFGINSNLLEGISGSIICINQLTMILTAPIRICTLWECMYIAYYQESCTVSMYGMIIYNMHSILRTEHT